MTDPEKHKTVAIPHWIKRAGAIAGIVATVAGILTGLVALYLQVQSTVISVEEQRTAQQKAIQGAEEAKLQQKQIELQIVKEQSKCLLSEDKAALRQTEIELSIASEKTTREKDLQDSALAIEKEKSKQLDL